MVDRFKKPGKCKFNYPKIIFDNFGEKELSFFNGSSLEFKNAYYGHVNTHFNRKKEGILMSPTEYYNYKVDKDACMSFAQIGAKLGIHHEQVRISYNSALSKIKTRLIEKGIKDLEYLSNI